MTWEIQRTADRRFRRERFSRYCPRQVCFSQRGGRTKTWSERWDLNPRPSRWQREALPLSYARPTPATDGRNRLFKNGYPNYPQNLAEFNPYFDFLHRRGTTPGLAHQAPFPHRQWLTLPYRRRTSTGFAKGGIRTRNPSPGLDPKSSAYASSATFAVLRHHSKRGTAFTGSGVKGVYCKEQEIRCAVTTIYANSARKIRGAP